jgi:hypothetical protein
MRIREIAQTRVPYGYRMIRVLLNREGWKVGKDFVYRRLCKEEGLGLRKRPASKRRAAGKDAPDGTKPGLGDGLRFRSAAGWHEVPLVDRQKPFTQSLQNHGAGLF